jgi:hypothetical protein
MLIGLSGRMLQWLLPLSKSCDSGGKVIVTVMAVGRDMLKSSEEKK